MATPVSTITRSATRKENESLNILCMPTHERYEVGLAKTNHDFYAWNILDNSIKKWDTTYAQVPENYHLLNPNMGSQQIPQWLDLDLVLSQNKFGQFNIARQIANQFQIPLISLEHTLPVPTWTKDDLVHLKSLRGDVNVFISDFSRSVWGWSESEALVVNHGIDTETFKPIDEILKKKHILSTVNDWSNRDIFCGFKLWQEITKGLLTFPVGKTPGLSEPAKDINELVKFHNEAQVFINTSLVSPIPMSLLEAMSSGSACVSTATCEIPRIIKNGYNGYLSNDPKELRKYLLMLLNDPSECRRIGQNARKTILEDFSMDKFVSNWNEIFRRAATINTRGRLR